LDSPENVQAATRRKDEAVSLFDAALREAKFAEDAADTAELSVELLQPKHHLVSAMYTRFREHVLNRGCRVKRTKLSAEEKNAKGITKAAHLRAADKKSRRDFISFTNQYRIVITAENTCWRMFCPHALLPRTTSANQP
jgi:hypothetical protein